MSLTNEKIADWIYQRYQDDYFRFDLVSLGIEVTNFIQNENQLIVDYEFWNDGHANQGAPEYFLFDIELCDEYDVYFPSTMEHVKIWFHRDCHFLPSSSVKFPVKPLTL